MRPDLADVRLAEQIFAPHYAAAVPRLVATAVPLRDARGSEAEVIATLQPGEVFELLDLVGQDGWGIACDAGLVGYLDAAALAPA